MSASVATVAEQFDDAAQQGAAADTGMWVFIASEILFFGALFFGYTATRIHFPDAFAAASRHTDVMLGSINTAVLLTSSYTMALALRGAALGRGRRSALLLALTCLLGAVFLGIKCAEYYHDYEQHLVPALNFAFSPPHRDGAQLFFYLYFVMTGFHALHLSVGMCVAAVIAIKAWRHSFTQAYYTPVSLIALYRHLVDVVWIFLYPLLYLVART